METVALYTPLDKIEATSGIKRPVNKGREPTEMRYNDEVYVMHGDGQSRNRVGLGATGLSVPSGSVQDCCAALLVELGHF